jgi:hypothetical protein
MIGHLKHLPIARRPRGAPLHRFARDRGITRADSHVSRQAERDRPELYVDAGQGFTARGEHCRKVDHLLGPPGPSVAAATEGRVDATSVAPLSRGRQRGELIRFLAFLGLSVDVQSLSASRSADRVRGFAWLQCENVPTGTKSLQMGLPGHGQKVRRCRGNKKQSLKIDGTKLEFP